MVQSFYIYIYIYIYIYLHKEGRSLRRMGRGKEVRPGNDKPEINFQTHYYL